METSVLFSKLEQQYATRKPFVLFAYPNSNSLQAWLQQKDETQGKAEDHGFLLAPFNREGKSYFQSFSSAIHLETALVPFVFSEEEVFIENTLSEENKHIHLVEAAKKTIQHSESLQKIVVSRKKAIPIRSLRLNEIIPRLFGGYETAFRYLWYHPETGLWAGATPETLVNIENNQYKTMALAGTKPNRKGEIQWTEKEREEQAIVTRNIISELKSIGLSPRVSDVYDQQAGSVVHLRTDITGKLSDGISYDDVAEALHPTPAVCGEPRNMALRFLDEEETYDREFYTGYLGVVNSKAKRIRLFVNLRCMQLEEQQVSIYVGGGITEDSNAADEWEETEKKLQTMARVIAPLL